MATEPPPPSHSPINRHPSIIQKLKQKRQTPVSFDNQGPPRQHGRSSSFSGFVSRILPSRREERGHTLRAQFQDDGSQDVTHLYFGSPETLDLDQPNRLDRAVSDGVIMTRAQTSCTPKPTPNPLDGKSELQTSLHDGIYTSVRTSEGPSSARDTCTNESRGDKRLRPLGRLLGLRKELDHGGGTQIHNHHTAERQLQKEIQMPVSEPGRDLPLDVDVELSKAQQIFEDKRIRREKRRSLRDSGDFLGIQGANPRTGYWDASTATSSSDPSQLSEETKKRLDKEAKDFEEDKRKWSEARMRHRLELQRVQTLLNQKKREKAEKKKLEMKAKQSRYGKWRRGENCWSSVAEPDLSPIVQSLAGSPTREISPFDHLFSMPTAADPSPYVIPSNTEQWDYFGHCNMSALMTSDIPKSGSRSRPFQDRTITRKAVGSPPSQHRASASIVQAQRKYGSLNNAPSALESHQAVSSISIRNYSPKVEPCFGDKAIPKDRTAPTEHPKSLAPAQRPYSFLDRTLVPSRAWDQGTKEAIATLYRSASTNQAVSARPLSQNLRYSNPDKRITSLKEFPPVSLKDPITARMPSSLPPSPQVVWNSLTVIDVQPVNQISSTTIPITTTTGYDLPQHHSSQLDGPVETMDQDLANLTFLQGSSTPNPSRTSSPKSHEPNNEHNSMSHIHPAAIVTLSEHQLALTKERTARLCPTVSPEREVQSKNIPISTYTFHQTPERANQGAYNAALTAFGNSRRKAAMEKVKGQDADQLTPPKTGGGPGDIGHHSKNKDDANQYEKSLIIGPNGGGAKSDGQDGLVVWHMSPFAKRGEDAGKGVGKRHVLQLAQNKGLAPRMMYCPLPKRAPRDAEGQTVEFVSQIKKLPRPGHPPVPSTTQAMMRVVHTIWCFVEPAWEPDSAARKRWERRRPSWQDIGLFLAAALFAICALMIIAGIIKTIVIVSQIMKAFLHLFRFVTGF